MDVGANIVRGLTLSEISSIRHVTPGLYQYRQTPMGMGGRFGGSFYDMGGGSGGPSTSSYDNIYCPRVTVTTSRSVTAVLVLFGLPRDLTASILCHEALHVWFKLTEHMPSPLSEDSSIEEGLCQYASMRYLEYLHGVDGDGVEGVWTPDDEIPPPTVDNHQWEGFMSNHGGSKMGSPGGSRSSSGSSSSRGSVGGGASSAGGGGSFSGSSRTPTNPLDNLSYCQEIPPPHDNKNKPRSSLTRTLRALFRSQIEMDESLVYGGGYRSGTFIYRLIDNNVPLLLDQYINNDLSLLTYVSTHAGFPHFTHVLILTSFMSCLLSTVAPCCSALGLQIVLEHVKSNRQLPKI